MKEITLTKQEIERAADILAQSPEGEELAEKLRALASGLCHDDTITADEGGTVITHG